MIAEPGYTTTEFWITSAAGLFTMAAPALGMHVSPQEQLQIVAILTGIYATARTFRKFAADQAPGVLQLADNLATLVAELKAARAAKTVTTA